MKTYVISRMYAGTYLDDNLGGEFINLLYDDNGNNYIFVGPYGFIATKYDDTVEGIILTRLTKAGCFEILGIAKTSEGSQVTYRKGKTRDECYKNGISNINNFVSLHNIKYGGVPLHKIIGKFSGADITFKSDILLLPKNELFITDSHTNDYVVEGAKTINLYDKRFPKQSLHTYITNNDNPNAFNKITALINDESLWEKDKVNKVDDGRIINKHFNFLDVIRKDYDELAYSNLLAYIFKTYPDTFITFAKDVLGVNLTNTYEIIREEKQIDLWIEDNNNIIVIENKIKSGISGVPARHDFSEQGLVQSQLLKFFNYTEENKKNKRTHYFLFVPNYNKINLKAYSGSKHYKVIRYSDLYAFFSNINIDAFYYKEFVKALYKHTKDREIDYAEDMALRFLRRLNQIKNK